jgi:cytosine/uracil/thiamine/allantoin permease
MQDHRPFGWVAFVAFWLCILASDCAAQSMGRLTGILTLVGTLACLSMILWAMDAWRRHRYEVLESRARCPQGTPGGKTRDRCPACLKERQEEARRWELGRQERERL